MPPFSFGRVVSGRCGRRRLDGICGASADEMIIAGFRDQRYRVRRGTSMCRNRMYDVLFLCTGNSARSIMAEALLNDHGAGRFRGFSAGSHPKGEVHPLTLDVLRSFGISTDGLRSKSWEEFARPENPELALVITVCDQAAGELCPIWPGKPLKAHWSIADPVASPGDKRLLKNAFRKAFRELQKRIRLLVAVEVELLDGGSVEKKVAEIGVGVAGGDDPT